VNDERRRVVASVIAAHSAPFEWGVRDCVTLAADVVRGIRGTAPVDVSWASEDEAAREIELRGGFVAAISGVLGDPYDPQAESPEDGDIILLRIAGAELLSVWAATSPIAPVRNGLRRVNARHAVLAWRV
jgi:hypothetical protein